MEDYEEHYNKVRENWRYGKGDMMVCPNPGCDNQRFVVEPNAYVGGFHGEIHNLRARCVDCKITIGIVVKPLVMVSFGNGTETEDPRPVLELLADAYAVAPVKMKESR